MYSMCMHAQEGPPSARWPLWRTKEHVCASKRVETKNTVSHTPLQNQKQDACLKPLQGKVRVHLQFEGQHHEKRPNKQDYSLNFGTPTCNPSSSSFDFARCLISRPGKNGPKCQPDGAQNAALEAHAERSPPLDVNFLPQGSHEAASFFFNVSFSACDYNRALLSKLRPCG